MPDGCLNCKHAATGVYGLDLGECNAEGSPAWELGDGRIHRAVPWSREECQQWEPEEADHAE